jgi:hypothetical protein
MPGYIYMIMMADNVFKIGMTKQQYGLKLERFKSYPVDANLIFVRRYGGKLPELEKMILVEFRKRFIQHTRGSEYFTGNEDEMVNVINNTFMYIRDRDAHDVEMEVEKHLETFTCPVPKKLQSIIWDIEFTFSNNVDVVNREYLTGRLKELGFSIMNDEIVYRQPPTPSHQPPETCPAPAASP